jgi:hypothetical protein
LKPLLFVFGGPSLAGLSPAERGGVKILPPAKRDDLLRLVQARRLPGAILLVDGLFGTSLAVSPAECRQVMACGWRLFGCSSLGALRAAELYSFGMVGIGSIYLWLRCGALWDDSDLASAFTVDGDKAISVPMVWVRAIVERLRLGASISDPTPRRMLSAARAIYWSERSWNDVMEAWKKDGLSGRSLARARQLIADTHSNPKVADATLAVRALSAAFSCAEDETAWVERTLRRHFPPRTRAWQ